MTKDYFDQFGDNDLMFPGQVAKVLGVSENTLAVWRSSKRYPLRYIKIGNRVRYKASDVRAFIERDQ